MSKKRYMSVFLMLIIIFSTIFANVYSSSVFNRQKKSIYLVMDDSPSMNGGPMSDANYSLQTLIAMTDKSDEVKLYFLNNDSRGIGDIQMNKKSNELISNIRTKYPNTKGSTPYAEVDTAQNELTAAAYEGDDTEYWLVVFTDGGFNNGVDGVGKLKSFSQKLLKNGTYPNVLFLTTNVSKNTDSKEGSFHLIGDNSVINVMNKAAREISGRIEANNVSYSPDNSQVTFNLPYSAKNIIVFTQNKKVNITDFKAESTLDTSENYTVTYPTKGNLTDSTVCFINGDGESAIKSGDVTLTFDGSLKPEDTVILFEPAVSIEAHYYGEGDQEITPDEFAVGTKIRVRYNICDGETKQVIPDSAFGGSIQYSTDINGHTGNANDFEYEITEKDINIKLSATLPDGYTLTAQGIYKDLPVVERITFTLSNGGNFKTDIDKLEGAEPIDATVLLNGKTLAPERFKDFSIKVKGGNFFTSRFEITKDENSGIFKIRPYAGWISIFTPLQKDYEVELTDKDGKTYIQNLNVEIPGERDWLGALIRILICLLIIYLICCQIFKKRLPFGTVFLVYNGQEPNDPDCIQPRPISLFKLYWHEFLYVITFRSFAPILHMLQHFFTWKPQKVMILKEANGWFNNFIFTADGKDHIYAKDKIFKKYKNNTHEYEPDYIKYDPGCLVPANSQNYMYGEIVMSVGDLLYKQDADEYFMYLRFTTRKKLKNNPYSTF